MSFVELEPGAHRQRFRDGLQVQFMIQDSPILFTLWVGLMAVQVVTVVAAAIQPLFVRQRRLEQFPTITVVVPLCGIDPELEGNLERLFAQDYPDFVIDFAVAHPDDAAIAVARGVIARHGERTAQVRIGENPELLNLKARNEHKSLAAATTDYVYIVDSNVALPPDALRRLMALMVDDVGLVAALPIAVRPSNLAAAVETAFINGFAARFILAGAAFGMHNITGKSMLLRWSPAILEAVTENFKRLPVEDISVMQALRSHGLKIRVADFTVSHPLGARPWKEVLGRQVRWARYRRAYQPAGIFPEIAATPWPALVVAGLIAGSATIGAAPALVGTLGIWYGAELFVHLAKRWPLDLKLALCWPVRDALLPAMWALAFVRRPVSWRGSSVSARSRQHE
jgi:ceramide glucosyltransferase